MTVLTTAQKDAFWRDGYLLVENAVSPALLAALRDDFAAWVAESRSQTAAYGETINGRPRFDLAAVRARAISGAGRG